MSIEKLTILHSNDIHGHFTGHVDENGKLSGSMAQVSGYVNKVKQEDPDAIYVIAGDVFQGSLIDSDFQGLSTADILNMLDLDVMSLGNHELDYGISHMLFVDKLIDATIVNTNFKIKNSETHLFKPYQLIEANGMRILFIGLLTKNIVDQTKAEGLVGSYVSIEDTNTEIAKIYGRLAAKHKMPDMTVLVTHIGYEADIELAKHLDPVFKIDLIIGGHSHTYLDEPAVVNDIVIVQAGMENTHIGRLDLDIDTEKKRLVGYKWQMIPVDEEHCPTDKMMKAMVSTYAMDIDEKYSRLITRFKRNLDNNGRQNDTEVTQLYADAFYESLNGIDAFLMASSSIRCYSMEMTVTLQDLRESYPYDGKIYKVTVDGKQLRQMLTHALRDDVLNNHAETYYVRSSNLRLTYSRGKHEITSLTINGKDVKDDQLYGIGLQEFYFLNSELGFGMTNEELQTHGEARVIASDAFEVLHGYMADHKNLGKPVDDRIIITD